jgi:hypothetical protein
VSIWISPPNTLLSTHPFNPLSAPPFLTLSLTRTSKCPHIIFPVDVWPVGVNDTVETEGTVGNYLNSVLISGIVYIGQ